MPSTVWVVSAMGHLPSLPTEDPLEDLEAGTEDLAGPLVLLEQLPLEELP